MDAELQNFLLLGFFLAIILSYFMGSFHFTLFVLFAGISAAFLLAGNALIGTICAFAAGLIFLHFLLSKGSQKTGKLGKKAREGIEKEWQKLESAKLQGGVGVKFYEESLKALGKKSAEVLFAKDTKLASPQPISRIAKSLQNFIDGFNKIFKK